MSAHDRYLSGYRSENVHVTCVCGNEWEDTLVSEYGTSYLTDHEECGVCGESGDKLTTSDSEYEPDYDAMNDEAAWGDDAAWEEAYERRNYG